MYVLLAVAAALLLYARFGPERFSHLPPHTVGDFMQLLREGDVLVFCAKQNKLSVGELVRTVEWAAFRTCFSHPVLVTKDNQDRLRVLHWTATPYSGTRNALCAKGHPNVFLDEIEYFFPIHAANHWPHVVYRIYRPTKPPIPVDDLVALSVSFCGVRTGPFRNQLQCIYFLSQLLQKGGHVRSHVDVYQHAYPGSFEDLLRSAGYRHYRDVRVVPS